MTNPLPAEWETPFGRIEEAHFTPAFEEAGDAFVSGTAARLEGRGLG